MRARGLQGTLLEASLQPTRRGGRASAASDNRHGMCVHQLIWLLLALQVAGGNRSVGAFVVGDPHVAAVVVAAVAFAGWAHARCGMAAPRPLVCRYAISLHGHWHIRTAAGALPCRGPLPGVP